MELLDHLDILLLLDLFRDLAVVAVLEPLIEQL